jgi:predicted dehydrogenase
MKLAFIGAGRISTFHYDAFKHAGADITGICTRGVSGKTFSDNTNVPYFTSIAEMCRKTSPDAAVVLTQPSSYPTILAELKPFNLPLFLEKPIAYSSAEAEQLKVLLPTKVFVGQNRRFYSGMTPIRTLLQSNEKLTIHAHINERAKDIKNRDQRDRDHWHVMNAIHLVDLLKSLFGLPQKVFVKMGWQPLEFSKLNTHTNALYLTDQGHMVNFSCNFDSPGGWRFSVFSSAQEIVVCPIEKTMIKTIGASEEFDNSTDDSAFKPGFVAQSRCFLDGITGSQLPCNWVNFDDALESVRLAETLFDN